MANFVSASPRGLRTQAFTKRFSSLKSPQCLKPNDDIIAETAHIEYVDGRGNIKYSEPIDRLAHMVFKGSVWIQQADRTWARAGWARIYLRRGGPDPLMEGAFSIMGDTHHVQLQTTYIQTKRDSDFRVTKKADEHMIIHRDSDTALHTSNPGLRRGLSDSLGCEADKLTFNSDPNHPILASNFEQATTSGSSKLLRHVTTPGKRQSDTGGNIGTVDLRSTIGNSNGCPTTKRVAMIGIATDCSYTASFDSVESVRQNIISMVNTASDVYERSFNITIGIQNLTISDAGCPNTAPASAPWNMPCSTGNMARRLDLFSRWRASRSDYNAYRTLLSTCSSGSTVGIAWLGQLCVSELVGSSSQSVTGTNVVVRTPTEWQIFAAAMESLRMGRTAIAAATNRAVKTPAAIQVRAGLGTTLCATIQTNLAARTANLPLEARCAGLAPGRATWRSYAQDPRVSALRITTKLMARAVATAQDYRAPAASVPVAIFNVKRLWTSLQTAITPVPVKATCAR
ncbi:hypothetical protein V500_01591 [Pseudogymnoascus sp. VKM F-4518 (FW-2643)]|nr:hypothetical protein V500_01591 [Pseudogymnoascus sp. VKM F-4518 (FW-2643)]